MITTSKYISSHAYLIVEYTPSTLPGGCPIYDDRPWWQYAGILSTIDNVTQLLRDRRDRSLQLLIQGSQGLQPLRGSLVTGVTRLRYAALRSYGSTPSNPRDPCHPEKKTIALNVSLSVLEVRSFTDLDPKANYNPPIAFSSACY